MPGQPTRERAGDGLQLAHMAPGERAQETAESWNGCVRPTRPPAPCYGCTARPGRSTGSASPPRARGVLQRHGLPRRGATWLGQCRRRGPHRPGKSRLPAALVPVPDRLIVEVLRGTVRDERRLHDGPLPHGPYRSGHPPPAHQCHPGPGHPPAMTAHPRPARGTSGRPRPSLLVATDRPADPAGALPGSGPRRRHRTVHLLLERHRLRRLRRHCTPVAGPRSRPTQGRHAPATPAETDRRPTLVAAHRRRGRRQQLSPPADPSNLCPDRLLSALTA
ncbi:hypothetical protein GA0115237_1030121 [Streptomyces sp. ScaeMP-6W]|nr:hypothetical protein GA0115237_1030121 [Streptomyces sp. ScaeMP-6W]